MLRIFISIAALVLANCSTDPEGNPTNNEMSRIRPGVYSGEQRGEDVDRYFHTFDLRTDGKVEWLSYVYTKQAFDSKDSVYLAIFCRDLGHWEVRDTTLIIDHSKTLCIFAESKLDATPETLDYRFITEDEMKAVSFDEEIPLGSVTDSTFQIKYQGSTPEHVDTVYLGTFSRSFKFPDPPPTAMPAPVNAWTQY